MPNAIQLSFTRNLVSPYKLKKSPEQYKQTFGIATNESPMKQQKTSKESEMRQILVQEY
jgi:hypothetical protein